MKKILNVQIILSFIAVFLFILLPGSNNYKYIILLPISTSMLSVIFYKPLSLYNNSIVFVLILLQIMIRYVILPLQIVNGDLDNSTGVLLYSTEAIFFMIIELFVVYLTISIFSNKYGTAYSDRTRESHLINNNIALISLMVLLGLYIYISGYFSRVNYIWNLQSFVERKYELEEVNSLSSVLFYPFRMIVSLMLISYIYTRRIKDGYKIVIIMCIVVLNSLIIVGTSRFSIILTVLPLTYIIYLLFEKNRKYIIYGLVSVIIPVIIVSSINKFSSNSDVQVASSIVSGGSINAYFSGPENMRRGIDLYYLRDNWQRTNFFINDIFQNVPILSKLTDDSFKTNIFFNEYIYGHRAYQDQIVPLSLNGLVHFGVLGPLIYPFIFISLSLFFERKFLSTSNIGYKLVYITIGITLSLIFMLNIGSLIANIFTNYMFLFIPIFFINKFWGSIKYKL